MFHQITHDLIIDMARHNIPNHDMSFTDHGMSFSNKALSWGIIPTITFTAHTLFTIRYPSVQSNEHANLIIWEKYLLAPSFVQVNDTTGVMTGRIPRSSCLELLKMDKENQREYKMRCLISDKKAHC